MRVFIIGFMVLALIFPLNVFAATSSAAATTLSIPANGQIKNPGVYGTDAATPLEMNRTLSITAEGVTLKNIINSGMVVATGNLTLQNSEVGELNLNDTSGTTTLVLNHSKVNDKLTNKLKTIPLTLTMTNGSNVASGILQGTVTADLSSNSTLGTGADSANFTGNGTIKLNSGSTIQNATTSGGTWTITGNGSLGVVHLQVLKGSVKFNAAKVTSLALSSSGTSVNSNAAIQNLITEDAGVLADVKGTGKVTNALLYEKTGNKFDTTPTKTLYYGDMYKTVRSAAQMYQKRNQKDEQFEQLIANVMTLEESIATLTQRTIDSYKIQANAFITKWK